MVRTTSYITAQSKSLIMKNQLYMVAIILLVIGCSGPEQTLTRIGGTIINPKNNLTKISVSDTTYVAELDSLGKFSFEFPLKEDAYATFSHGGEMTTLYLTQADNITLSLDTEKFDETLTYEGKGSENNKYMAALVLFEENAVNPYRKTQLAPNEFVAFVDSIRGAYQSFTDGFKSTMDPKLYTIEVEKAKYSSFSQKINYPAAHKRQMSLDSLTLPEGYYDFLSELSLEETKLLGQYEYTNALIDYIHHLGADRSNGSMDETLANFLSITDSLITNKEVKGTALAMLSEIYIAYTDINKSDSLYNYYRALMPEKTAKKLEQTIAKLKKLAPGTEVPDFKFYTSTGDSLMLSDFEGKLVYVDLWATWCGPCIAEQPHWEKLVEEMKETPIVFLGVSIDDTTAPWEKMLEARKLGGTQVWAKGAWTAEIMSHFAVEGIPQYILIDADRKIITRNAPRPSGKISELLKTTLAEKAEAL